MADINKVGIPRRMDDETALAFAGDCFQKLHAKSDCPEWLARCTTIGYHNDIQRRYIVSFGVTPLLTNRGVCYFQVAVDPNTAETIVLLDRDLAEFVGEELQGFVPFTKHPWIAPSSAD